MTVQQGERVIALLEQILDRVDQVFAAAHDDIPDDVCPHPEDKRVSLSSWGDRDHWLCSVCRFDNKAS